MGAGEFQADCEGGSRIMKVLVNIDISGHVRAGITTLFMLATWD
jgi:hypothetical protein